MSANNAAHTQGPWCFEDGVSCISHKRGDITAYHRAGSQTVAHVEMWSDPSYVGGEDSANARLIAAAPELLEALERFCVAYEQDTPLRPAAMVNACNRAREVIAKVTGGAA